MNLLGAEPQTRAGSTRFLRRRPRGGEPGTQTAAGPTRHPTQPS